MKTEDRAGLLIAYTDSGDASGYDVVYATKPSKNSFYVPLKITYQLQVPSSMDEYMKLLSKNRRKKFKRSLDNAASFTIDYEFPIQKNTYDAIKHIYVESTTQREKGIVRTSDDWYEVNKERGGSITARKESVLSGLIFRRLPKDDYFNDRLSTSFVATTPSLRTKGMIEVLHYHLIQFAIDKKMQLINRGFDSNLYGHHLSVGLHIFKVSTGYIPKPHPKMGFYHMTFNSFDKFSDVIYFISIEDDALIGNILYKKVCPSLKEFQGPWLKELRVYKINNEDLERVS